MKETKDYPYTTEVIENKRNARQCYMIGSLMGFNSGLEYRRYFDGYLHVLIDTEKHLMGWFYNNAKKLNDNIYNYRNEQHLMDRLGRLLKNAETAIAYKEEQKQKRKEETKKNRENVKVGDLYYTSWGYEQTNIDFYKVVGLVGKATAEIVKIGSITTETTSWGSDRVKPNPEVTIGEPFRVRITAYGLSMGKTVGHATKTTLDKDYHRSWYY